tara:strand:+ start:416 stop:814 length:399 start_codon:yes stop_codon:yes gene_type:complete
MKNIYVILGHKLKRNSNISKILKSRLDKGIEKYKKGDIIIVSGGNNAKVHHTEAYVMKKYLINTGNIPSFSILTEGKSLSTEENIINLSKIISRENFKRFSIITSKTHIPKVKKMVKYSKLYHECLIKYIPV